MTTAWANRGLGVGSCGVGAGVGWGVGEAKVTQGRKSKAQVPCLGYAVRRYLKIKGLRMFLLGQLLLGML